MNSIHDQAKSIFLSAAEIATPEERHKFVDKECGDNHELRREVDELLRHQQALGGFLESPATLGIDAKATMPAPGETIRYFGDYELLEEIARGGMGVVFKARQVTLNRVIALKMILAGQLASDDDVRRFRTEAEAAANLDHPGIVPIYEIGQHGGQHYFSMKLIEGGSLSESLSKFAQNPRAAAELVCKLAEAVHHAHQRGILHRDLKPANVLIDEAGKPHITDFGLARQVEGDSELTRTGAIVGTPSYMPPEQARGEKSLTTATDVYSLGAILYELLTGQAPFKGSNPVETVLQVLGEEPKSVRLLNSKIDRDLELICLKCLKKEPDDRYSSAAALKSDLEHWLAGEPLSIRAPAMTSLMRLWLRQNFGAAGWTLVIGLVFGLGVGMLLWTATLQREVVQVVSAYTHLESEQLPWLLKFDWQPPTWLANAFILVGIFLGSYLGYFTALLVRPKNRDADIAAGLVVSLVGGLALFIAFLGPIGLYANFNNDDIRLFQVVAGANANVASGEFTFAYPDMKAVPDRERAALLYNKICADQLVNDRKALWVSLLASVVMSLFIGVGETMAAGPLLRRGTWYGALLRYTELGIAISALTFVLCANLLFPMLFTMASYAVWKVLLMTAAAGIAIWLAANRRHWVIRVIALVVWMACFLSIVVHDFERYGHAGDLERRVARARHHISVKPDAVGYKTELGYWLTALADFWHRNKDWNYAIGPYEEALDTYRPLVKQGGMEFPRGEVLRRMKDWYPRLLETYDHLGRPKDRDYLMEVGFWHKNLGDFGYSKEDWSYVNDQYEQALATYQQILKENKGDKEKADEVFRIKEWYLRLVQSRDHLGRHKEAEKLMTDFDPQNIDQWREIAFFILRPHCDSMLKDKSATPAQCAEYVKNFVRGKQKNADAPEAAALVDHVVKALTQQNHWQVIGPFPGGKDFKGLATSYEPEQEKAPKPTYKVGDKTIAWKPVDVRPGDGVDLLKEISQSEYVVAYASTTFESPKEQKAVLRVGSDDGCKIWLNGELVHEIRVVRSCYEGSDQVKVKLKKGANQLLFKIETAWGGWGYSLDVIDESGWPMQLERHAQSK